MPYLLVWGSKTKVLKNVFWWGVLHVALSNKVEDLHPLLLRLLNPPSQSVF